MPPPTWWGWEDTPQVENFRATTLPTNNNINILRGRVFFALVLCVFSGVLSSHVVDNVFEGGRLRERATDGLTQTNDTGDDDEARTDSDKSELGDGRSVWSGLVSWSRWVRSVCSVGCVLQVVLRCLLSARSYMDR